MPGVFLSHSSLDKRIAGKIAVDLALHDIPVWLDSWELELADRLTSSILEGIDDSAFLIVALSTNAIASDWVHKELSAALAKEQQLGHQFIVPIKIGECVAPDSIADRIYADFTRGYTAALERLVKFLRSRLGDTGKTPFERRRLPLVFLRALYLERVGLQEQYERLVPDLKSGAVLLSNQLISMEIELEEMRNVLRAIVDDVAQGRNFSPSADFHFRSAYRRVMKLDAALLAGLADISNGLIPVASTALFAEVSHWYGRILRNELLAELQEAWQYAKGDTPFPIDVRAFGAVLSTETKAARLYDIQNARAVVVFNRGSGGYFNVWVDSDGELGRWVRRNPQLPEPVISFCVPDFVSAFLVPQMVAYHRFYNASSKDLPWEVLDARSGWMVGLS